MPRRAGNAPPHHACAPAPCYEYTHPCTVPHPSAVPPPPVQYRAPTDQVRAALLLAYDDFLSRAFGAQRLCEAGRQPADERFAVATPGGAPWRRSLIPRG